MRDPSRLSLSLSPENLYAKCTGRYTSLYDILFDQTGTKTGDIGGT